MECRQWDSVCHTFVSCKSHISISKWQTNWWTGRSFSVVRHTFILQMSCVIFCSDSILAVLHEGVSYFCMFNVMACLWNCKHAMKACSGTEVQPHSFLTGALDGGEWSSSQSRWFNPRERAPVTHCTWGLVNPREGSDILEKRRNSGLCCEGTTGHTACCPVTVVTELSWPTSQVN